MGILVHLTVVCLCGQTPSKVLTLSKSFTSHQSLNGDARLVSDGNNGCIVVYRSKRNEQPYAQLYYQRITENGKKIPAADGIPVAFSFTDQSKHTICSDKKGGIFIVWQEEKVKGEGIRLYAQHMNERGENLWNPEGVRVCAGEKEQLNPRIISDDEGGVFIFWEEDRYSSTGKDLFGQHLDRQARPIWGFYGKGIVKNKGIQQNITLISAKNNRVFVIWEDYRATRGWKIMAQKVNYAGETQWSDEGVMISIKEKFNARSPKICSDGFGGFFCVYQAADFKSHHQDIFLARVSAYNDILYHKTICEAAEEQNDVQVATDGDKVIIFWRDYRNGEIALYAQKINLVLGTENWEKDGKLICAGLKDESHLQAIISPDTGGRWMFYQNRIYGKDLWVNKLESGTFHMQLSRSIPLVKAEGDQFDYQILTNERKDGVWIVWTDEKDLDKNTLRYQFWDFNGKKQFPDAPRGGENLLSDGVVSQKVMVDNPVMTLGKHNDVYVAWEENRHGKKNIDIYIQRLDSVGNPCWGVPGRLVCGSEGEQSVPRLMAVEGGVIVGWSDRRDNDDDLYVQFFDTSGISHWKTNGLALCTEPHTQNNLGIYSLNKRKFLFTWTDARKFYEKGFDIYYQILDIKGKKTMSKNGEILEEDDTYQSSPVAVISKGEAEIIWMDERTGPYNLRAARLNPGGKKLFRTSVLLIPGTHHQRFPRAAVNDSGQVFVVWNDDRNGPTNTKVYLMKIDTSVKSMFPAQPVCGFPGRQSAGEVISNDRDGVFVGWLDQRDEANSGYNLYIQRFNSLGKAEWTPQGVHLGEFMHSFNPYQLYLGSNCNLLAAWSEDLSAHLTKVFWAEMDPDSGIIRRKFIIDTDEGSQLRPSILQFPDYSVGVLWLQKYGLPFSQELKIGFYKPDDFKTSQGK